MNQILVTEKLYVTPELRRKKKIYKINFIISIVIITILCSFYLHSEYARNKEESISQGILAGMIQEEDKTTEAEEIATKQDEGVWKIMISYVEEKKQEEEKKPQVATQTKKKKRTYTYTASNNKRYQSVGRIQIPKINVDQVILDETDKVEEHLKIAPIKFYGADPNEIGNCCIAGHNYRNTRFFSKVPTLVVGDKIKITDASNRTITYSIFDKYTVDPDDTSCLSDNINGKRMITLITCTNDSKQRVIVQAKEV